MKTLHAPLSTLHSSLAPLLWPKKPAVEENSTSLRRIWTTRCGRYRVVHAHILFGLHDCYADRCYAQKFEPFLLGKGVWDTIGTHWKLNAAMQHCEKDARRQARPLAVSHQPKKARIAN